jgi:hypothetical protein
MTTYQPEIIQKFADRSYTRAAGTIVVSAIVGIVIGFAVEPFVSQTLPPRLSILLPTWTSAVVFGILGVLQGMERAFVLRLQAQTALCQMQIERNTRRPSENASPKTES